MMNRMNTFIARSPLPDAIQNQNALQKQYPEYWKNVAYPASLGEKPQWKIRGGKQPAISSNMYGPNQNPLMEAIQRARRMRGGY